MDCLQKQSLFNVPHRGCNRRTDPISHTLIVKQPNEMFCVYQNLSKCQADQIDFSNSVTIKNNYRSRNSLLDSIKDCGKKKNLGKGCSIHAAILQEGLLQQDVGIGTALITMYAKCGDIVKAQKVFDELPFRDTVSWTALIGAYVLHGLSETALSRFQKMKNEGISPNFVTFNFVLKACGGISSTENIKEIHQEIKKHGLLENNVMLLTTLVDLYCKCGALENAKKLFDELPSRDVVSWTALISGYVQHGLGYEALNCFKQMQDDGISPNAVTFSCLLKACGSTGAIEQGEKIHTEVKKQGLLKKDIILSNMLVDMYVKCGKLAKAQEVFDELPVRDATTWNVLISGYAKQGLNHQAMECFEHMLDEGNTPDVVTFVSVLKICGNLGLLDKGKKIHAELSKQALLKENVVLGNALVDMYIKCSDLCKAEEVFDELQIRDVVTWTALIVGYTQNGLSNEALGSLHRMQEDGISPNAITYASAFKACAQIHYIEKGEEIHHEVKKKGYLIKYKELGTALLDMYAKCGALQKAQEVFDDLPIHDVVTWTALIAAYMQHGSSDEAVSYFKRMQEEGISPDVITFSCVLKACSITGCSRKGEEVHAAITNYESFVKDPPICNSLVDMYVKCGKLTEAQQLFDENRMQDVVTCNALASSCAQFGDVRRACAMLSKFISEDTVPDSVTFLVLLAAYSHAGLVEDAETYWDIMSIVYCLVPNLEHYSCMVDLFVRAGQFDKAMNLISEVSPNYSLPLWSAVMGGNHGRMDVGLARCIFEHLVQLDENSVATYIGMSNIYAASAMFDEMGEAE